MARVGDMVPIKDIANEARKVGAALTSIRIDQMIVSLATGIALGQFQLDRTSINITKMMGVPDAVTIGEEQLSMLEAGILPTFYHFVDTILEVKMEVKIREEIEAKKNINTKTELSFEAGGKFGFGGMVGGTFKTKAAYTKTVDTTHSQKYSQDLTGTSLIRTKIVPKPAPDLLVQRIEALIEEGRASLPEGEKFDTDKYVEQLEAGAEAEPLETSQ